MACFVASVIVQTTAAWRKTKGAVMQTVDQAIEEYIEIAYWLFHARMHGHGAWAELPMTERDAFKSVMRKAIKDSEQLMEK